ncbi:MAG: hypothetical protein GX786_00025 [Clostridiales bacterium]|nr:hypothetical protein [Clostridiales bacterium]
MSFVLPTYHPVDFSLSPFVHYPNVKTMPALEDGVVPEDYHATTIFPEYFKIAGTWVLAEESRMDCVAVLCANGTLSIQECRNVKKNDQIVIGRKEDGSQGVFVHTNGFEPKHSSTEKEVFVFRQNRTRETAYSKTYDQLFSLLRHEKQFGHVLWVLGPAVSFDSASRKAMAGMINNGYCHGVLAGNALATHDLEAAHLGTALGQDIYSHLSYPQGHYHHIDLLNRVRAAGSISAFIDRHHIDNGIIHALVNNEIPFVLAGSIRDDGPLPEVYANVYDAQDAMRKEIRKATTIICLATQLHSIATGNMTPSYRVVNNRIRPLYFYNVDISEFALGKLKDRGSLTTQSFVTNLQDFLTKVYEETK